LNETSKIYFRPWGCYQTLALTDTYQVKIITVNPNSSLSLQKHVKRAEHWTIVQGRPTITVDQDVKICGVNDAIYIPVGALHRIENFTIEPVIIVEVQIGSYLGEDDIVRIEDIYNRHRNN